MEAEPTPAPAPAPAVSAEAQRLIYELYCTAQEAGERGPWGDADAAAAALLAYIAGLEAEVRRLRGSPPIRFSLRDHVRKTKGSSWHGRVVGFYSTNLTPIGYAVESSREPGSVQIYPESALEADPDADAARRGRTTEGENTDAR